MAAPPLGMQDTVYAAIIDILEADSAAQDEEYRYDVEQTFYRMLSPRPANRRPIVVVDFNGMTPQTDGSATRRQHQYRATYNVDMIVTASGKSATGDYERADQIAAARLRLLIQQVLSALYRGENLDLGLDPGEIAGRPMPTVLIYDRRDISTERPVVGARITVPIEIPFTPEGVDGPDLERIAITQSLPPDWEAYINPDVG